MKHPEIRLEGIQLKSADKVRKLARALSTIEVECGIRSTRITLVRCFVCPDIDWSKLQRTPMQRTLAAIAAQLQ